MKPPRWVTRWVMRHADPEDIADRMWTHNYMLVTKEAWAGLLDIVQEKRPTNASHPDP